MAKFSQGRYALSISDRSGQAFPYLEMVKEWTGAWVHISEYEKKSPLISPKPYGADPQALQTARPARTEFYTPTILPNNPFTTTGSSTTVTVDQPDHGRSTGDAVRFRSVVSSVGGVSPTILMLETTLASDLTDSATTMPLCSSVNRTCESRITSSFLCCSFLCHQCKGIAISIHFSNRIGSSYFYICIMCRSRSCLRS